jgi:purine-nucleoside phosphorylase
MPHLHLADLQSQLRSTPPDTAIVLGSGLSGLTERLTIHETWNFAELPGLVIPCIQGHRGQLVHGTWAGRNVLVFAGRVHYYEGHSLPEVIAPIRLAAGLGIKTLILTNAAGGVREGFEPGTLMSLFHHLNATRARWWARGSQKGDPIWYDYRLRDRLLDTASRLGIPLEQGIYACLTGPSYETPAEIRALRTLGVDAVGMSTALEAEEAYRRGMLTVGISCITNIAAGVCPTPPHLEEVLVQSKKAAQKLGDLLEAYLAVN